MSLEAKASACALLLVTLAVAGSPAAVASGICEKSDAELLDLIATFNAELAAAGFDFGIEQIDCYVIGGGRPSVRVHQQPFRWVAGDARRQADGDNLTYIVDQSGAGTSSGVAALAAEAAIDRAMDTWQADSCLDALDIVKRVDPGSDITVFDFLVGAGGLGDPFAADIVHAGWFPAGPPFFGPDTVGFSITFVFMDANMVPTDVNGDQYLDTSFNEVYYNDGLDWGIDVPSPQFDVETGALHESGHSLGIGHFGPPPDAVMNPDYVGLRQELFSIDHAGMCAVWESWPT